MNNKLLRLAPLGSLLILAGCSVGPDYHGAPSVPLTTQFTRQPHAGVSSGQAQSQWWLAFDDARLNQLIAKAMQHNPDLDIARARLQQSRAALAGDQAQQMPKLDASGAMVRAKLPDSSGSDLPISNPVNLYSSGFDASWELDLFGGQRRTTEAGRAQQQASEASLADTQVAIAADVASNYLQLCGAQEQLANLQHSLALQQQMLTLTQQRQARGAANDSDVNRLQTQLENSQAELPNQRAQINGYKDQLAFLSGLTPGALDELLSGAVKLPAQPGEIEVGNPTDLLRRRPDVRSAERKLAASTATVGEHIADLYPKITLRGILGFSSDTGSEVFSHSNGSWLLIPMLQWNILDFGRIRSQINVAKAQRDEAEAEWRKTVLNALRDANGSLSRYGEQRRTLVSYMTVEQAADRDDVLMKQRYNAGVASLIDVLDTQRTQLSASQKRIQSQTDLALDYVALQKSLGLGWQSS